MAIILNDNIKVNAGKPSESKYLNGTTAYVSVAAVNSAIPITERYIGLTVLVITGGTNVEYWYQEGVDDGDLEEKKYDSEIPSSDFITGATNLGFFSGKTGIQKLTLTGDGFSGSTGFYFSEYNWYYADSSGIINIGSPIHNGPLRRAYVDVIRNKSWIWNVGTGAWIVSDNDVVANVGNLIIPLTDGSGTGYTNITWDSSTPNGNTSPPFALVTPSGILTTGTTFTVGNPIYRDKSDQELHLRTIKNQTPNFINTTFDDNYIYLSGNSSNIIFSASNGLTKTGTEVKLGGTITGTTTLIDSRTIPIGIEYGDDYSTGFTDNSLVSKLYVDTKSLTALGGERIFKTICQTGHGFALNNVVGYSGGSYTKPVANGLYDGEVIGIVSDVYDPDSFQVTQAGYVSGLTPSLTPNYTYFLSDTTPGLLTDIEPTTTNYISKSMMIATSQSTGWVLPYAGYVITSGITGGALVKTVCNPIVEDYYTVSTDYYIGVSGGSKIYLQPNYNGVATNGTVIVVSDICGNASPSCYIAINGSFFGGGSTACIDTAFGSLSVVYNGGKSKWDVVGFSVTPH